MMLFAKFGRNWGIGLGLGEEVENVKSLLKDGQTDRRTDTGQKVFRKAYVSF